MRTILLLLITRVFSALCPISASELTIFKDLSYCLVTIFFNSEIQNCTLPSTGMFVKLKTKKWEFFAELTDVKFKGLISLRFECSNILKGGTPTCMQELDGDQLLHMLFIDTVRGKHYVVPILRSTSRVYNLASPWTNPYFVLYSDASVAPSKICMHFIPRNIPLQKRLDCFGICLIAGTMSWQSDDNSTVEAILDGDFLQKDSITGCNYYNHTAISQFCTTCSSHDSFEYPLNCNMLSSIMHGNIPNVIITLNYITGFIRYEGDKVVVNNTNAHQLTLSSYDACVQTDLVYDCFWTVDTVLFDNLIRQHYYFREDAPKSCYFALHGILLKAELAVFINFTSSLLNVGNSTNLKATIPQHSTLLDGIDRGFYNEIFWVEYNMEQLLADTFMELSELLRHNISFITKVEFRTSDNDNKELNFLHRTKFFYVPCQMQPKLIVHAKSMRLYFSKSYHPKDMPKCVSFLLPRYSHQEAIKNLAVQDTNNKSINACTSSLNNTEETVAFTANITEIRLAFYEKFLRVSSYMEDVLLGDFHISTLIPDTYFYHKKQISITCDSFVPAKLEKCRDLLKQIRIHYRRRTLSVVVFFNDVPYPVPTTIFKEPYLLLLLTIVMCTTIGLTSIIYVLRSSGIPYRRKEPRLRCNHRKNSHEMRQ